MANTSFKTAIKELEKNYKEVLKGAVQYATEEAEKDIHNKALSCLEAYYNNYKPTNYTRTDSLRQAFLPYSKIKSSRHYMTSTVGVEYNTSLLTMYTVGSYDYGNRDFDRMKDIMPIEEWIMDNYLDGIHPRTDGSPLAGTAQYLPIYDEVSPTDIMNKYLTDYVNTFTKNVYSYLTAYLLK